jgi:hypothetical protein
MSTPARTAARYPATDAATKARILSDVREIFGEPWTDDDTALVYETLLVLDRLGYLYTTHGFEEAHPAVET